MKHIHMKNETNQVNKKKKLKQKENEELYKNYI